MKTLFFGGYVCIRLSLYPESFFYPNPNFSNTLLSDDLGTKRSLYQELGVSEYWVVNVETASIVAFNFQADNPQIRTSLLLPGLEIAVLEQALLDRTTQDDSQIMATLLKRFQE
jgi:Uma2 family endonuclease